MNKETTIGEKYKPAMEITDPQEAARYFEECVAHAMSFGADRTEAERIERANLGYFAGYYSSDTRGASRASIPLRPSCFWRDFGYRGTIGGCCADGWRSYGQTNMTTEAASEREAGQ